ncbi:hypothetical protein BDQ12DRAFT_715824 [Crucibulum laeve]|uniref:Uncharacterized protein n=1 Tax=Crucibulum laeve TaxID=68775 RepID=A0A5C3LJS0_9AGAR|nr:hypothetical protein BDQ12DRAFT_715824 [Crucibulum laeve]
MVATFDIDHKRYNAIRLLLSADAYVRQRLEDILSKLRDAKFNKWEKDFGVCLVHRHFELKENEVVLERGLVSQPAPNSSTRYAERWVKLDDKYMAYEFTDMPTSSPPKELWDAFIQIVSDAGMSDALGLFYLPSQIREGKFGLETSSEDDRTNTIEYRDSLLDDSSVVRAAWRIGSPSNKTDAGVCTGCTLNTHHVSLSSKVSTAQT